MVDSLPTTPRLRSRLADRWTRLRRAVLRRRRALAALCAAVAVAATVRALAPPAPATTEVLVAGRDLPAGAVLTSADLSREAVPPGAVPDDAVADPVGETLAAPLRRGEPVTDVRLVGPGLTTAAPGTVAVPIRLSDGDQAGLLTVGDQVDLYATDPQHVTTELLAAAVTVLALPDSRNDTNLTGRLAVVGVPAAEVENVTAATVTRFVTYAWTTR